MSVPALNCPTCKLGNIFKIGIAKNRIIVDCWTCSTRFSIPIKEYDHSKGTKVDWNYIEYSTYEMIEE